MESDAGTESFDIDSVRTKSLHFKETCESANLFLFKKWTITKPAPTGRSGESESPACHSATYKPDIRESKAMRGLVSQCRWSHQTMRLSSGHAVDSTYVNQSRLRHYTSTTSKLLTVQQLQAMRRNRPPATTDVASGPRAVFIPPHSALTLVFHCSSSCRQVRTPLIPSVNFADD
jgi:hypothetical protein